MFQLSFRGPLGPRACPERSRRESAVHSCGAGTPAREGATTNVRIVTTHPCKKRKGGATSMCCGEGFRVDQPPLCLKFCDIALPVPLAIVFTYRIPDGMRPVVGGRVLVPFRQQRMSGIVVELHDRKPQVQTKNVLSVLDSAPVLDDQLLKLGKWIADYYLAPLGEVFRTMLPLNAEFKRAIAYRVTPEGQTALHLAGMS